MLIDFNSGWRFKKEGGNWQRVRLPHDAMLTEKRDVSCPAGAQSAFFPGGKYVYEKSFSISNDALGKSLELHFGGVYQNCTVSVNCREVGAHKYGFTPFTVDISEAVTAAENTLTVEVDNTLQPSCRWYSGAGIYRSVALEIRDKCHIKTLNIETLDFAPARIHISAETTEKTEVIVEVYDGEKLIASGTPGEFEIPNARLWTAETPYLYTCIAKTATDKKRLQFGIRKLEWSAKAGLLVNGNEVKLRGGCIHHDHGVLGACCYSDAEERRVGILKQVGYNAIRCAHNPASSELLEVCDRLGMYVMDEAFDGWYTPKNYHDYARFFDSEWKSDLTAMVENARNHPCVIMYSIGNEVSETATDRGVQVCRELADFVRGLDPTRPVTAGVNVLLNVYSGMGIGVYKDKGEYKPVPLPPRKSSHREKKTGSAFFNAMVQKLGPLMFFMSKGKKGDAVSRGAAEALDVFGLNYASSRLDSDTAAYPERMMVGAETIIGELPYNWSRVKKYKAVIGDFCWAAWDYLGEAGVGDWTYYSYKGLPLLAGSGAIDITGKPGAENYFQQVVWGQRREPFIGVRPLNHADELPKKSAWRFTDCIDSWSWKGFEGKKAVIEVYSGAHSVRLSLNGRVIGTKKLKTFRALFKTVYEPGNLTAEALDENGRLVSAHSLESGGSETVLSVKADKASLRAGSGDLCFVEIEFTDENGKLLPYMEQRVELEVTGSAELIGLGSALGKTDEVFDKSYHNSHRGRAMAVFRAGLESGKGQITVKSAGVSSVSLELSVIQ